MFLSRFWVSFNMVQSWMGFGFRDVELRNMKGSRNFSPENV